MLKHNPVFSTEILKGRAGYSRKWALPMPRPLHAMLVASSVATFSFNNAGVLIFDGVAHEERLNSSLRRQHDTCTSLTCIPTCTRTLTVKVWLRAACTSVGVPHNNSPFTLARSNGPDCASSVVPSLTCQCKRDRAKLGAARVG